LCPSGQAPLWCDWPSPRSVESRRAAHCSCYDGAMLHKDATAPEIEERFVEVGEYILYEYEKERPFRKRSQRRLERLIEEQSSLERRLKRLHEE